MPLSVRAATPKQLDAVAHVLGRLDVGLADRLDALHVDLLEVELGAEGEARQNGELVRGIEAANVERRIGLGIAELLRLLQRIAERAVLVGHGGEDEVAGAVEDPVDAPHLVSREEFAQRLDDGDTAGHRGLEVERDALLLGELGEFDAVLGEQCLVGGDDVLAGIERRFDRILGDAVGAADQLDERFDFWIARQRHGIVEPGDAARVDAAAFTLRARRDADDLQRTAGALRQALLVKVEQLKQTRADGAKAGDAQGKRLLHGNAWS